MNAQTPHGAGAIRFYGLVVNADAFERLKIIWDKPTKHQLIIKCLLVLKVTKYVV